MVFEDTLTYHTSWINKYFEKKKNQTQNFNNFLLWSNISTCLSLFIVLAYLWHFQYWRNKIQGSLTVCSSKWKQSNCPGTLILRKGPNYWNMIQKIRVQQHSNDSATKSLWYIYNVTIFWLCCSNSNYFLRKLGVIWHSFIILSC